MLRAGRLALVSAGLLASASALWWLRDRAAVPPVVPPAGSEPSSEVRGLDLVDMDADGTRWSVSAEEGEVWETEGRGELKNVKATFEKEGREVRASAGRSRIESREEVRLMGGVSISWENYRATADEASYRRGEGRVTSDGPVTLKGPGVAVKGRGLEVDVQGSRARILSDVTAIFAGDRN